MDKNDHVHEARKVRRSDATSIKIVLVIHCGMEIFSFEFCNDTFIGFEMPRYVKLPDPHWENKHCCFSVHLLQRFLSNLQIKYCTANIYIENTMKLQ